MMMKQVNGVNEAGKQANKPLVASASGRALHVWCWILDLLEVIWLE